MQAYAIFFLLFYAERVVFLPEITDCHRDQRDHHLARRGIPAEGLDTQFETEIINRQIDGDDEDISRELTPALEPRTRERDVLLQPETSEQRDRKDDTQGRYVRRYCLRE